MTYRPFILSILFFTAWMGSTQTPVKPFQLRIVREQSLPDVLQLSDCILGTMYLADSEHPLTRSGDIPIGPTLELPWRYNQNEISAIPAGSYSGKVREDGALGWRIELDGVPKRSHIEVHLGNWPKDTAGCILFGKARTAGCSIANSTLAMKELREHYNSPSNNRPIQLTIVDR